MESALSAFPTEVWFQICANFTYMDAVRMLDYLHVEITKDVYDDLDYDSAVRPKRWTGTDKLIRVLHDMINPSLYLKKHFVNYGVLIDAMLLTETYIVGNFALNFFDSTVFANNPKCLAGNCEDINTITLFSKGRGFQGMRHRSFEDLTHNIVFTWYNPVQYIKLLLANDETPKTIHEVEVMDAVNYIKKNPEIQKLEEEAVYTVFQLRAKLPPLPPQETAILVTTHFRRKVTQWITCPNKYGYARVIHGHTTIRGRSMKVEHYHICRKGLLDILILNHPNILSCGIAGYTAFHMQLHTIIKKEFSLYTRSYANDHILYHLTNAGYKVKECVEFYSEAYRGISVHKREIVRRIGDLNSIIIQPEPFIDGKVILQSKLRQSLTELAVSSLRQTEWCEACGLNYISTNTDLTDHSKLNGLHNRMKSLDI